MAEPVGALRVDVAANVAQIREDMGAVKAVVNSAAAQMARGMVTFGKGTSRAIGEIFNLRNALIVTAAAGLVAFVKRATDAGDEIAKTAQKIGISTDKLQELRYAAASGGVKIEDFDNAMLQLSKRLGDNSDQVTEVSRALGRLGLSIADVKGKDAAEVFALVADRIGRIPDPMDRARIATDLFGKAGQQLLPVLMGGSKELARLAEEARKLGLVIPDSVLKKAEEANDEFTKMGTALKAAGVNIAVGFLPALKELRSIMTSPDFQESIQNIAKSFGDLIKWMVENKGTVLTIAAAFQGMRMGAAVGGAVGGKRGAVIGGVAGALGGGLAGSYLADNDEVLAKIHEIEKENALLESQLKATAMKIAAAPDSTTIGALATQADQLKAKLAQNRADLAALKKEGESKAPTQVTVNAGPPLAPYFPEAEKAMRDLQFQTRLVRGDFDALAEGFPLLGHGLGIFGTETQKAVTSVSQLPPQLQQLNQKMLEFKGAQLTQEMLNPWERYAQTMERLNQLLAAGTISQETYNRAMAQATSKLVDANVHAQSLGQSLEQTFGAALEGNIHNVNDAVRMLIGSFLKMEATAGFKTLLYGNTATNGGSSGILGALFGGLKLPGFASGGTILPGGSGSTDSQLIAFYKSPNEQVNVGTPGQLSDVGSASGAPIVYNDNRTFNDVTPDLMSKIELRLRAERPKTAKYVMEQMKTQRARDPHFYDAG
jgi:hypothetical protein